MKRGVFALFFASNAACGLIAGLSDHQLDPGDGSVASDAATSTPDATMPTKTVTLARGQADPRGISADLSMVYWANEAGGSVAAVAKDGSQAMPTILSNQAKHPRATQVSASQIFWAGDTADSEHDCMPGTGTQVGLVVLDKAADAAPTQLYCAQFDQAYVGTLTIDGTDVYWTNSRDGLIGRTRQGSGTTPPLLVAQEPEAVALNTTNVFWSRLDGIATLPKSGFPPDDAGAAVPPIATATSAALGLGADETDVYYTTPSSIMKVAVTGGVSTTLADTQNGPSALALFGNDVYWTNAGAGTVMTIPKSGGNARVLASGQGGPSSIVVDAAGVFWTNASGEVMGLIP